MIPPLFGSLHGYRKVCQACGGSGRLLSRISSPLIAPRCYRCGGTGGGLPVGPREVGPGTRRKK